MNVKLATFMLFVPSAVLMGSAVLIGDVVWGSASPHETRVTGSVTPQVTPQVRGAGDFTNGDWRSVRDENFDRAPAHVAARDHRDYDGDSGPFTREEARSLRDVWSTIREAENFHDINWRTIGFARAPGDREARRFMADHWGSLRRAERFDDINWRAEYHRR